MIEGKKVLIAVVLFGLICGCAKEKGVKFKSTKSRATVYLVSNIIYPRPNQKLIITGRKFPQGNIPENSISIGDKKLSHKEIIVEWRQDGSFSKAEIILKDVLPCGVYDLKIKDEVFEKAIKSEPIVIEYMMWGVPDELETVKTYLKKFEEKFPYIKVKILHVTQAYDDKLKTMFAAKTPPDVMYMGLENFPSFASRNVFLELDSYIQKDKEFKISDFYPSLLEQFKYNGKYYGLPKDFTTLVLYYNKDLFDKAGLKYPNETWTWDTFLSASKKLTKDIDGDGRTDQYGFVLETWFQEWIPWVWQNGGEITDKTNTKWLLGDPQYLEKNAEAIQFLTDLVWKYKVAPTPSMTGDLGTSDMFKTGKVAMCSYGRWMCMQFKHIKDFKWDVSVMPKKVKRGSTLFVVSYAISKETKHPDACWELIKFLLSRDGQIAVAESGHAIASRISVADSKHFLSAPVIPQKINARAYLDSIAYARPSPTNPVFSETGNIIGQEMDLVFRNKKTAVDAIKAIQPKVEQILNKLK